MKWSLILIVTDPKALSSIKKNHLERLRLQGVWLSNILQGPLLKAPLLMQTKRALAAVWRVAPGHITVVLGQRRGNELTLENVLTVLSEKEYQQSTLLLDLVPSDLPSWSR